MYSVEFKSKPAKFIRKQTKNIQTQILDKIESLKVDPVPANSTRLRQDPSLHRVRTGDYRIIYNVSKADQHVIVTKIGHRSNVYDDL